MTIQVLKQFIESPTKASRVPFMVWVDQEGFITNQYIKLLVEAMPAKISTQYDDSIEELQIIHLESLNLSKIPKKAIRDKVIFVTAVLEDDPLNKTFEINTLIFPKLALWQVQDYAYSNLLPTNYDKSISTKTIDNLINICSPAHMLRLNLELDKLKAVITNNRNQYMLTLLNNGYLSDIGGLTLSNTLAYNIFIKDKLKILELYSMCLESYYTEVYKKLYIMFRQLALVQLGTPGAVPESLTVKKVYIIGHDYKNLYTNAALIDIMINLSNIDYLLAVKTLNQKDIIKYILTLIF